MRMTEELRQEWINLLRGGAYRPTVGPAEAGTSLLAYLLASPLDVTESRVDLDDAGDEPIPALLPRDWPAQVERLVDDLGASNVFRDEVRTAALALVDGWVLAAATTLEPTRATLPDDWERRVDDVVAARWRDSTGAAGVAEAVRELVADWTSGVDRNHGTGDGDD